MRPAMLTISSAVPFFGLEIGLSRRLLEDDVGVRAAESE